MARVYWDSHTSIPFQWTHSWEPCNEVDSLILPRASTLYFYALVAFHRFIVRVHPSRSLILLILVPVGSSLGHFKLLFGSGWLNFRYFFFCLPLFILFMYRLPILVIVPQHWEAYLLFHPMCSISAAQCTSPSNSRLCRCFIMNCLAG